MSINWYLLPNRHKFKIMRRSPHALHYLGAVARVGSSDGAHTFWKLFQRRRYSGRHILNYRMTAIMKVGDFPWHDTLLWGMRRCIKAVMWITAKTLLGQRMSRVSLSMPLFPCLNLHYGLSCSKRLGVFVYFTRRRDANERLTNHGAVWWRIYACCRYFFLTLGE